MSNTLTKKERGNLGELFVAKKLEAEGFSILARNYRKTYGEIDIIAKKGSELIFVEVKLRSSDLIDLGELISAKKQLRIISVAKDFLSSHTDRNVTGRFDVALVTIDAQNRFHCDYIANAFTPHD